MFRVNAKKEINAVCFIGENFAGSLCKSGECLILVFVQKKRNEVIPVDYRGAAILLGSVQKSKAAKCRDFHL